jgi:uncharacterized protein (TIGR02145 family)
MAEYLMYKKILWYLKFLILSLVILIVQGCKKTDTNREIPCPVYNINKPHISPIKCGSISPSDGAVLVSPDVILSWDCIDTLKELVYSVYFGTSSYTPEPIVKDVTTNFLSINGLDMNKIYYWSVVAKENIKCGVSSSIVSSFLVVADSNLSAVMTTTDPPHMNTAAYLSGNVIYKGSSSVSERGLFISTIPKAEITGSKLQIGIGMGSYSISVEDLKPTTTYYIKAYATNNSGTSFGDEVTFITGHNLILQTVKDIEGNLYECVTIGSQVWMAENLKTTKYNDGAPIPLVADSFQWVNTNYSDKYCWYNNDELSNKNVYGALYSFPVVKTGKLCPTGWHVPSDLEWHKMILFLDATAILRNNESGFASDVLTEGGTKHWINSVEGAYNGTGFTGIPGGYRISTGRFYMIGENARWWTSTYEWIPPAPIDDIMCWIRILGVHIVWRVGDSPLNGYSVRCVKN